MCHCEREGFKAFIASFDSKERDDEEYKRLYETLKQKLTKNEMKDVIRFFEGDSVSMIADDRKKEEEVIKKHIDTAMLKVRKHNLV
jgi:uncharacterized membrane-anchored protein YjiN (DUF445 family)